MKASRTHRAPSPSAGSHASAIALLVGASLLAFWPVIGNDFVNWDDPTVIVQNPQLTAPTVVRWAFSTTLIEQTLRIVPDQSLARENLQALQARQAEREGDRLADAGRLDDAERTYARALRLDTKRIHARAARAVVLTRLGRTREAVPDLRNAYEGNPRDGCDGAPRCHQLPRHSGAACRSSKYPPHYHRHSPRRRHSCMGLIVTVRQHLYGRYTLARGTQRLGTFRGDGQPMDAAAAVDAKNAPTAAWKTPRPRFPQRPQASL